MICCYLKFNEKLAVKLSVKNHSINDNMEHGGDGDNSCTWNNPQKTSKGTGRLTNQKRDDHPDYKNTEKSPGD